MAYRLLTQSAAAPPAAPPLVLHIVYRFDIGGLENGVVNLINHMPGEACRHAVLALTDMEPSFVARIRRPGVATASLGKPLGHGWKIWPQLLELLRRWRPAIVHTRNLAALECQPAAWWAGVPVRVHGEHGRDIEDPHGDVRRYQWIRRAHRPFVDHYVTLSQDLTQYVRDRVGVPARRVTQILNGVDAERFRPLAPIGSGSGLARPSPAGWPFGGSGLFVFGTVGRMQTVKAQPVLAEAFVRLLQRQPSLRSRVRLVMAGDGPLCGQVRTILEDAGIADLAWMPGPRSDVPDVMRGLDCFVLPSLAEGISNTILEAMATGLPVVATRVGGNAELVADGRTGMLVAPGDADALASAMAAMVADPGRAGAMGTAGRAVIEQKLSLVAMVHAYRSLYDRLLQAHARGSTRL